MGLMGFSNPPNFFLGLVRAAAWLLWREPVAKPEPPQPKRPRKPTLGYTVGDIPFELMAVVRIAWYRKGALGSALLGIDGLIKEFPKIGRASCRERG